jgi:two-component system OmpR family response regulator
MPRQVFESPVPSRKGTRLAPVRAQAMTKRTLRRILLVEDDPDMQEVTALLLSSVGEVRTCGSAAEALQAAQEFDPDLILLDVMMPGLDGQGAFAAFRQMPATANTPVIFVTACVQPGEISEYRQLGSLGVIPKPFDPDTLAETIQEMWERHENARLNEARREELAALRGQYAAELPERVRAIESLAGQLQNEGWDGRVAASLYEMAHRLAGSAAIYGFAAVGDAAMRVAAFGSQHPAGNWAKVDPRPLIKLVATLSAALRQSMPQNEHALSAP